MRAQHDGEVLDRRVLLSDLSLCGAALDCEAKDRRVLHSVIPRTLRGITITNLLVSECYHLPVAGACSTKSEVLKTSVITKVRKMGHHL